MTSHDKHNIKRSGERYRQVSSLGRLRELGVGDPGVWNDKCLRFEPGQILSLADIKGPGRIVRIWITLPVLGRGPILRNTVWRMFWDGESQPSVECPVGDLFGAAFGRPVRLISDKLVINGGGYLCRFEMPFTSRARIEVENQGSKALKMFFYQIGYYENSERSQPLQTFHAQWKRECPTTLGQPYKILDAKGRGRFVGLKLDMQNLEWWLKPPIKDIALPQGFGLGMLEGWETMFVDGEEKPSIKGTGTEDYFSGGWYFKGGPFCTPVHGATVRSYLTSRCSAYRWHVDDPVIFKRSISVNMDHGLENVLKGDYCSVAYWYQEEPHAPFDELPSAPRRKPVPVWTNSAQILLCASAAIFVLILILWILSLFLTKL